MPMRLYRFGIIFYIIAVLKILYIVLVLLAPDAVFLTENLRFLGLFVVTILYRRRTLDFFSLYKRWLLHRNLI